MNTRVGIGYDAHRLTSGRKLILCGVHIPFEKGLLGWSDADVAIHAIIDGLLGAAALGDIGTHFPSDDAQYEGISSLVLLEKTASILKQEGWQIGNIDVTIVAQEPRLGPFINQMQGQITAALSLGSQQVSIKAKTADKLGFTGRGEGIEAHAVTLVRKSDEDS